MTTDCPIRSGLGWLAQAAGHQLRRNAGWVVCAGGAWAGSASLELDPLKEPASTGFFTSRQTGDAVNHFALLPAFGK